MSLHVANKQWLKPPVILVLSVVFSVIVIAGSNLFQVRADNQISDLHNLILRLREESYFETGIVFKFRDPLIESNASNQPWVVPYNNSEEGLERILGEVGADYVCFTDIAGSSTVMRCTPFSNIVSIGVMYPP